MSEECNGGTASCLADDLDGLYWSLPETKEEFRRALVELEGREPTEPELATLMGIEEIATMPGELSPYLILAERGPWSRLRHDSHHPEGS